jgi:hypothetical protein
MGALPRNEKRLSANTTVKVVAETKDSKNGMKSQTVKHGPKS